MRTGWFRSGLAPPCFPTISCSAPRYLEFRRHQTAFSAVTSWSGVNDCDLTSGEPIRLVCASVESSFLGTLGIVPALGRSFTAEEDGPNKPRTVLLSYGIWQSRFGGRPDILGRTIAVDGEPSRVVGILPPDFETPTLAHADLVIPQRLDDATLQRAVTGRPLRVIARLRPGNDHRGGAGRGRSAGRPRATGHAAWGAGAGDQAACQDSARSPDWRCQSRSVGSIRLGAGCVALACANVANLLMARTEARRRELALRVALGAGRMRLIRQAVTESLLLAALGGFCGLVLAYVLLKILVNAAPGAFRNWRRPRSIRASWRSPFLCSLASGLIFGMGLALAIRGAADSDQR